MWRTWCEGDIDSYKVKKIDQALRRLAYDSSVRTLDRQVVGVAGDRTPKQLQTWLNRFVAHTEPDRAETRHKRAFSGRGVCAFQELDGMGWISGAGTAVDVAAFDAMLIRRAQALGADDPRSLDQRRADIYMDILMGRDTNGYVPAATRDRGGAVTEPGDEDAHPGPSTKPAAVIGVTIPASSLFGLDDVPGDLFDRSNTVPAPAVRELATREGTLGAPPSR